MRDLCARRSNFPLYRCCTTISYLVASHKHCARAAFTECYAHVHTSYFIFFSHGYSLAKHIDVRARAPHGAFARDTRRNMYTHTRVYANTRDNSRRERERERERKKETRLTFILHFAKKWLDR